MPIATAIFIKKQAEKQQIPIREAIAQYSQEAVIPIKTLEDWVWPSSTKKRAAKDKEKRREAKSTLNIQGGGESKQAGHKSTLDIKGRDENPVPARDNTSPATPQPSPTKGVSGPTPVTVTEEIASLVVGKGDTTAMPTVEERTPATTWGMILAQV